ncbi:MAG TPA: CRTAC1 family protein, partial [Opitutus sp.]|nr:CRTAC1 family protein [Opitutus sp.]
LNTPYRADPAHPALLFHGDFRGNGTPIAIEALFDGERLRPRRTRSELGAALPAVTKRFPRNDAYASASLNDILGDGPLAQARRFSATELRSGVFLSQPDGTYRFALLPNAAQVAPIQGLAAADFDGDGFADIYALHNSYSPVPSMGRFDGGLSVLLRGDGRGHFTPAPASESGLVVPGDAKALAVLDWNQDGWPDFFITRNRLPSLAMENRGRPARHPLAVRLRGAPGNAAAIGARVELETTDGRRQSAEVFAGSGYFSQSSATCFFGWTDDAAPRRIHVRWPHGHETTADVAAGVARFEIALPTAP